MFQLLKGKFTRESCIYGMKSTYVDEKNRNLELI